MDGKSTLRLNSIKEGSPVVNVEVGLYHLFKGGKGSELLIEESETGQPSCSSRSYVFPLKDAPIALRRFSGQEKEYKLQNPRITA